MKLVIIFIQWLIWCPFDTLAHSRYEGYFNHRFREAAQPVIENNIGNYNVLELVHCGWHCLKHPQCNSFFFSGNVCILHDLIFTKAVVDTSSTWMYYSRKQPYSSTARKVIMKSPFLMVFSIHTDASPFLLDVDSELWLNLSLPSAVKLQRQVTSACYDTETGTLYTAGEKQLLANVFRSVADLRNLQDKTVLLNDTNVNGLGLDRNLKVLFFFLDYKKLASMKVNASTYSVLKTMSTTNYGVRARIGVDEQNRFLYFNNENADNHIYGCDYQGKESFTLSLAPNVKIYLTSFDPIGRRILFVHEYKKIGVYDLKTRKMTNLSWPPLEKGQRPMLMHLTRVEDQIVVSGLRGKFYVFTEDLEFDRLVIPIEDCSICEVNFSLELFLERG